MSNVATIDPPGAVQRRSVLLEMAARYGMEPAAFEQTLRATVVPANCTREQFASFLLVAREYDLNPVLKQIYAMPTRNGGIQPIVGVDGWANIINAHPAFDGMDFVDELDGDGGLTAIKCVIFRKDRAHPVSVVEYMEECRGTSDPWKKWPRRMLRHKAMIQCARYAFGFAGIVDPDEAERIGVSIANLQRPVDRSDKPGARRLHGQVDPNDTREPDPRVATALTYQPAEDEGTATSTAFDPFAEPVRETVSAETPTESPAPSTEPYAFTGEGLDGLKPWILVDAWGTGYDMVSLAGWIEGYETGIRNAGNVQDLHTFLENNEELLDAQVPEEHQRHLEALVFERREELVEAHEGNTRPIEREQPALLADGRQDAPEASPADADKPWKVLDSFGLVDSSHATPGAFAEAMCEAVLQTNGEGFDAFRKRHRDTVLALYKVDRRAHGKVLDAYAAHESTLLAAARQSKK